MRAWCSCCSLARPPSLALPCLLRYVVKILEISPLNFNLAYQLFSNRIFLSTVITEYLHHTNSNFPGYEWWGAPPLRRSVRPCRRRVDPSWCMLSTTEPCFFLNPPFLFLIAYLYRRCLLMKYNNIICIHRIKPLYTIKACSYHILLMYIQCGGSASKRNQAFFSPLDFAAQYGKIDVVSKLLVRTHIQRFGSIFHNNLTFLFMLYYIDINYTNLQYHRK